jgi:GT2 family glycosyltransferase
LSLHFSQYILQEQTSYFQDVGLNQVKPVYSLDRIGASCILFDMNLFSKVGLFDPVFHMYGEDNDLCMRVKSAGGSLILDTQAHVHHYHALTNADSEGQKQIQSWFAISRLQLRIRYSHLSRSGFMLRSVYYFLKGILGASDPGLYPSIYLKQIPRILTQWKMLKTTDIQALQKRIVHYVHLDLS